MMEAGRDSDALAHLVIHRESILDTQSLLEMTGASSIRLNTFRLKKGLENDPQSCLNKD